MGAQPEPEEITMRPTTPRARRIAAALAVGLTAIGVSCGDDGPLGGDDPGSPETVAPSSTGTGDTTPSTAEVALRLEPVDVELDEPLDAVWADGSLFVVERAGTVVELRPDGAGGYEADDLLDLREEVGSTDAEKGLLGVEVTQDGSQMFLNHTRAGDGATVIAAYDLSGDAGSREASGRAELLVIDQPYPNHNGGDLALGPDGMLWVGTGDGGAAGDPEGRAQRLDTRLGKLLRLDPGADDLVPGDNPHADGAEPLIWARGLRNPWRISFDTGTGDLWIADVGQGNWEEIDVARASEGTGRGADFGWDRLEGVEEFEDVGPTRGWPEDDAELIDPVHVYSHDDGRCSVTGGYLYRGSDLPNLEGTYLFSDYCDGVVRSLDEDGDDVDLGVQVDQVASINPDERGEPLVLRSGGISRLVPAHP
jgi:glucose/arabinose dehydrogenase